jgi:hypothetical protein
MPLRQTVYGGECPLDKFRIDVPAGAGCYDKDPVEACLGCNFSDTSGQGFDLEKICQCPPGMDWDSYDRLKEEYLSTDGMRTKRAFQEFVRQEYKR